MAATSTYPAEFFSSQQIRRKAGYCFVLMPFDEALKEVYETIKDAIQGPPWNFICKRADDFFKGGHILSDILRGIAESEIVIADLTGRNPNVFYELGVAHMVKAPAEIVLITQNMDSVPFDLRGFRCIPYKQSMEGGKKLKQDLLNALNEIARPVYRFEIEQGGNYLFPHRLGGDQRCLYSFSMFADYLGVEFAKYSLRVTRYVAGQPGPDEFPAGGYGIGVGELREIPRIPWSLRLDASDEKKAAFSVVYNAEAGAAAI